MCSRIQVVLHDTRSLYRKDCGEFKNTLKYFSNHRRAFDAKKHDYNFELRFKRIKNYRPIEMAHWSRNSRKNISFVSKGKQFDALLCRRNVCTSMASVSFASQLMAARFHIAKKFSVSCFCDVNLLIISFGQCASIQKEKEAH